MLDRGKAMKRQVILIALLTGWLMTGANTAIAQERSYINPRSAGSEGPPFSGAVLTGNTLYISGMLGLVNGQIPGDPAEEARVLLDSIKATVERAGMTMDDLVFVQIFCSDVVHYDTFNAVYRTYFTREFPARAFLGSGTLLFNARFEMQAIAVKR
jgi:2-iminobutanoate/2-iminopropanoate deaminase